MAIFGYGRSTVHRSGSLPLHYKEPISKEIRNKDRQVVFNMIQY